MVVPARQNENINKYKLILPNRDWHHNRRVTFTSLFVPLHHDGLFDNTTLYIII